MLYTNLKHLSNFLDAALNPAKANQWKAINLIVFELLHR